MASDQKRIEVLEEMVAYLLLSTGNQGILSYWRNSKPELYKAVMQWIKVSGDDQSTNFQLEEAAKDIRQESYR